MATRTESVHRKVGVIGHPVSHSLSPRIHNYWLKKLGIDAEYVVLDVAPEQLGETFKMLPAQGFVGFNLTIPHKEKIIPFLTEISVDAKKIGAVNTVVFAGGKATGHNTDKYGFMQNLKTEMENFPLKRALVLGAGGAARAVCAGLLEMGCEVTLINRTRAKAEALAKDFKVRVMDWNDYPEAVSNISLLVNTTSLGMKGQPALDLDLKTLPNSACVTDIVYSPQDKPQTLTNPTITPLLEKAWLQGNPMVGGLGMLLYQAQAAFEMWFGVRPVVDEALRVHVLEALW